MDEIRWLIDKATAARAAQTEKHQAFGQIVRRFQDMVFGCAYALLGDFHLAEDAAQETFIVAWRCLDQLRAPEAFPGWLKRIALTQCHHLTRGKSLAMVALESAWNVPSAEAGPQEALEQADRRQRVLAAIQALPEAERMVTTLFYIGEYSQNEIAAFLEAPLTTVKKRLWCARQKLREKMLDIVRDTLQEQRPSRDEQFAGTVALCNEALESLVNKLKQDRYILAAILYGSLSHDQVWEKSDIDLLLISAEEKKGEKAFNLVENGVNIHATLLPRSRFRKMLEGSLQSSFAHSCFAKSTLLFSWDESIKEYYADPPSVGAADRQWQLLKAGSEVVYLLAKAEKWLVVKHDVSYSFLWTLYAVNSLARIETLMHSEVTAREVIHQALKHNPRFFKAVYTDLIYEKKDEAVLRAALEQINRYLDEKIPLLFQPVLDYLAESGGARSTTEMDAYLGPKVQTHSLASAYEWLADKGVIRKVSAPVRLHEKSRITMDEAAYYYDGNL